VVAAVLIRGDDIVGATPTGSTGNWSSTKAVSRTPTTNDPRHSTSSPSTRRRRSRSRTSPAAPPRGAHRRQRGEARCIGICTSCGS